MRYHLRIVHLDFPRSGKPGCATPYKYNIGHLLNTGQYSESTPVQPVQDRGDSFDRFVGVHPRHCCVVRVDPGNERIDVGAFV